MLTLTHSNTYGITMPRFSFTLKCMKRVTINLSDSRFIQQPHNHYLQTKSTMIVSFSFLLLLSYDYKEGLFSIKKLMLVSWTFKLEKYPNKLN